MRKKRYFNHLYFFFNIFPRNSYDLARSILFFYLVPYAKCKRHFIIIIIMLVPRMYAVMGVYYII